MNDTPLHFTMRELRRLTGAPHFWLTIAAIGLSLGVIGPFGTYGAMPLALRLGYWLLVTAATYLIGHALVAALRAWRNADAAPSPLVWAMYGALAGGPVAALVWLLNAMSFGVARAGPFAELAAAVIALSAVVTLLVALFERKMALGQAPDAQANPGRDAPTGDGSPSMNAARSETATPSPATPNPATPTRPRILDRLPPQQRGQLSHMSMQDHYVDVRTDRGGGLLLMRFSDAIAETAGVAGLQVHRSHWVACDMVAAVERCDGKWQLRMQDGAILPVSRGYLAAARAAGLIPTPS